MSDHGFGRVCYSTIITPDEEGVFYYSYSELQDKLNNLCKEHTLKKVYADLKGYLESFHHSENYYDFSYFGGPVILVFDNIVFELCIHGMGMVEFRNINPDDIRITDTKDFPPDNMGWAGDNYFYDLSEQFELNYEGQVVREVIVDNIDAYPFSLSGFDEKKAKKAEETNSLPDNVHFHLGNGVDFGIYSDSVEWFYIKLRN